MQQPARVASACTGCNSLHRLHQPARVTAMAYSVGKAPPRAYSEATALHCIALHCLFCTLARHRRKLLGERVASAHRHIQCVPNIRMRYNRKCTNGCTTECCAFPAVCDTTCTPLLHAVRSMLQVSRGLPSITTVRSTGSSECNFLPPALPTATYARTVRPNCGANAAERHRMARHGTLGLATRQ